MVWLDLGTTGGISVYGFQMAWVPGWSVVRYDMKGMIGPASEQCGLKVVASWVLGQYDCTVVE